MNNILITGGAGFVPSSLAEKLSDNTNNRIILVDNFLTGLYKNIPIRNNIKFIKADVNDYNSLMSIMTSYRFDYVFHYAAVVGVERTTKNPSLVLKDIDGIRNVLELCKNTGVKRVFFSSSSEVYGEPVLIPQHEETTPLNSKLPYAVVKNLGECYCRSYNQEFGLDYTILRFFNTYGPKQSPDFVIAKFKNLATANKDITIYGDGTQTRTFCYIQDNVDFTEKILSENLCINDVVNVGNDIQYTIIQLAQEIINISDSKSKIIHLPALKEGDMTRRQPDNTKMKSILNRDLISLQDGLRMLF